MNLANMREAVTAGVGEPNKTGSGPKETTKNNQRQPETRGNVYNQGQTGLTVARVSVDKELLRKLSS